MLGIFHVTENLLYTNKLSCKTSARYSSQIEKRGYLLEAARLTNCDLNVKSFIEIAKEVIHGTIQ